MPYRYLPEIAIADAAFEAWGESIEDLFIAAADATMNVMVADLQTIVERETRIIQAEESEPDMLLFQLLQELIFYKDAEKLLLKVREIQIQQLDGHFRLRAQARGEELDPLRHDLVVDVKAVTLHQFRVEQSSRGWEAQVILDI